MQIKYWANAKENGGYDIPGLCKYACLQPIAGDVLHWAARYQEEEEEAD